MSQIPSYHLCPDFSISPPPNGHLTLGSIISGLDLEDIMAPLNLHCEISIPSIRIYPRDGPDSKTGFTRTMKELRATEGSIWAKICSLDDIGGKLGFLRKRSNEDILTVEEVQTRYFIPTQEYMSKSLDIPNVASFVQTTKMKLPVFMVIGLKVAIGAKVSKAKSKTSGADANAEVAASGVPVAGSLSGTYMNENTDKVGFDNSKPFILGIRLRKIWWVEGIRYTTDKVAGATLADEKNQDKTDSANVVHFIDDFGVENALSQWTFQNTKEQLGIEYSDWILSEVDANK